MNNKPVAWMDYLEHSDVYDLNVSGRGIPLYTHPVSKAKDRFPNYESICLQCGTTIYKPFKELTDEEIIACIDESEPDTADMIRFARAILRKAQEK